jgi:hypothetical protein
MLDVAPHTWVQRLLKRLYGRDEIDTYPTCYRLNRRGVIGKVSSVANLEWVAWRAYASAGYFSFSPTLFRLAVLCDWSLERLYRGLGKIYFTVVLQKSAANPASANFARAA